MNIFEGGRRIAKVIGAIFVIPAAIAAIFKILFGEPYAGGEILGYTVGCFAIYWILVAALGWIIRGFLGIQRGQDYCIAPIEK